MRLDVWKKIEENSGNTQVTSKLQFCQIMQKVYLRVLYIKVVMQKK